MPKNPASDLKQRIEQYFQQCDAEASNSLERYLANTFIDSKPVPLKFGEVAEPWQQERNKAIVPALEYACGMRTTYTGRRNFWWECCRGLDKTSGVARYLNGVLAYARRPLNIVACAADKDQARLLQRAMLNQSQLKENSWYGQKLDFKANAVDGPGGHLDILASDGDTNQGQTPDIIVADEITVWKKPDLWDAIFSTTVKRPDSAICVVITNCGTKGSWVWELRELVRQSPEQWFFYAQEPFTYPASWMTKERIADARKFMSEHEAKRLLDGLWIDPAEECGYLTAAEIVSVVGVPDQPPPFAREVIALDYGSGGDNDRTALCRAWYDGSRVHVIELECWSGPPGSEVPVSKVEEWVNQRLSVNPNTTVVADKYQLLSSIQRWELAGVRVKRVEFRGGKYNFAMATQLRDLIRNRGLVFRADAGRMGSESLATELSTVLMKKTSYGERFDHRSNAHDDMVFVLGTAAIYAISEFEPLPQPQLPPPQPLLLPTGAVGQYGYLNWAAQKGILGL